MHGLVLCDLPRLIPDPTIYLEYTMIYYCTEWLTTKNGKKVWESYQTKSETPAHARLREQHSSAYTSKLDTSVEWPFGVWSVIVHKSRDDQEREASRNQQYAKFKKAAHG